MNIFCVKCANLADRIAAIKSRVSFKKAAKNTVPVVIPKPLAFPNSLPEVEDFYPYISGEIFWKLTGWLMVNQVVEIAGAAVWDEESNEITWVGIDNESEGSAGHVISNSAELTTQALMAGHGVPNVQWHTHPGFTTFFSSTDEADQVRFVQDAARVKDKGYHIFMVVNQLSWRLTMVEWERGVAVRKRNGHVVVKDNNTVLDFDSRSYAKYYREESTEPRTNYLGQTFTRNEEGVYVIENYGHLQQPTTFGWEKSLYVGTWSDDEKEYEYLFDLMGVPLGKWSELYYAIADTYGISAYRTIIEDKQTWSYL